MVTGMREMKDSGVEWVGLIPKDWIKTRVQFIGRFINGYAFKLENWGDEGLPIIRIQDLTGNNDNPNYYAGKIDNKYRVVSGDILISWAATLAAFRWNKGDAWLNQHIFKAIPNKEIVNSNFFFWLMNLAMNNMNNGNKHGIMMQHVTADIFNKFPVCLPQIPEQKRIAAFLDAKCAEIDALSADIQSEIETLEAYRRSVITEAVTKGLDKNAPTKDSGIEWVGEIPTTWDVKKGKYCLRYVQKPTKPDDDVITCFRDGEVTLRKNRREEGFTISLKEIGYQGIDVGDLIVHGMDGFAGAIGISDSRGKASPVLNVLDTDNNKRYIMYYLRSLAFNGVFLALSTGIRVRTCDTNWGKLRELLYVLPPKKEQDDIVRFIDERLNATDEIIAQKQEQLAVLADYKKSIIYEYVTGKKEVPVA